jgi:YihY family inner membrane protein
VKAALLTRLGSVIDRLKRINDPKRPIGAFITKLGADNVGMLAGFMSWSLLTAIIPIVVGIVVISSLFLHNPASRRAIVDYLSNALAGVLTPQDIQNVVSAATAHSGALAIIGFAGILWGSSNVGGAISTCFQAIFEVAGRPFIREKLIDLGMLLLITAALLVVLAGTFATAFLSKLLGGAPLPGLVQFCVGTLVSYAGGLVLFSSIYLVYPNIAYRFKRGHVWYGALPAAAALQVVSYVWPVYVQISHFSKYSAFLFSLLVLTAWIYLLSMILLIGAEIVAIGAIRDAQRHHRAVGPPPGAALPQHLVLRQGHRAWKRE